MKPGEPTHEGKTMQLQKGQPARTLPPMHNPTHEEPFAVFVQAMADELLANAHKGDRAGWLTMNEREAVSEVLYHAAKLAYATRKFSQGQESEATVLEYAADVANCALMVADVCGVLKEATCEHQWRRHLDDGEYWECEACGEQRTRTLAFNPEDIALPPR